MNNSSATQLIKLLVIILVPIIITVFGLIIFLIYIHFKEKKSQREEKENKSLPTNTNAQSKQSIFNFMEFDTVRDNMIIQKKGTRYLMVVECQGINYDLMSGVEKTSVEEGFVQFLNTLRYPVQIYIQTRSINLESSLAVYRDKVKNVETKLRNMQLQYEQMMESGEYTNEELRKTFFELTKQTNLFEYGKSVLQDTEKMSLNKNILNKKYYLVIPYYSAEAGNEKLDKTELEGIAFSELYTRAQSLIRSISVCGVRGKILQSNALIELLYMAYNRDEAETFGLEKAIKAGFDEIYSTAPNVLKKKMVEIDKMIENKAIEIANQKVDEAKSELERRVEEKEDNIDELIAQMAKMIIKENEQYLGTELTDKAIEKVDEDNTKEGGNANVQKKTTKGRKKSTTK